LSSSRRAETGAQSYGQISALVYSALALLALVLFPLVWLLLLPLRLVGIVVGSVFDLIGALFGLPARLIRAL